MLIDIGVNLSSPQFSHDMDEVIARAFKSNITGMISTGTSLDTSKFAFELALKHYDRIWATAGIHPHNANTYSDDSHQTLALLLSHQKVVAIGECGLDYNRSISSPENQRKAFERQLSFVEVFEKPLFLHERDAFVDFHAMLRDHAGKKSMSGIVHCFTGTADQAAAYLEMGLDIGITGWITDKRRNSNLLDALKSIPINRLHLETDAPYLKPMELMKKKESRRNEPAFLGNVAQYLADSIGTSKEEIILNCGINSRRLFNLT
jgi:TatD DNase family protein